MTDKLPYVVSSVTEAPEALRARFQEFGYLFFRKYVAASDCAELLRRILAEVEPHISWDEQEQAPPV